MKVGFKNLKITSSIISIWLISLVAMITFGAVAFVNTQRMYKITNDINSDAIPKLKSWGDVNADMGVLRNTLTKIIDRKFDKKNEEQMLKLNQDIMGNINKSISMSKKNKGELSLANKAKSSFVSYYSYIPDIIAQRKKGIVPDPQITNVAMGTYGTELQKRTEAILNYEKREADTKANSEKVLHEETNLIFTMIFLISIILISGISIAVIVLIKSSIKEFNGKLKTISNGNLNVQKNTLLTNEFGVMHNSLDKTVEAISQILSIIKKECSQVENESGNLEAISKEMDLSVKQSSEAIGSVTEETMQQAEELIFINKTMESFGQALEEAAIEIKKVDDEAKRVTNMSQDGNSKILELAKATDDINGSFSSVNIKVSKLVENINEISGMINIINSVSEQTNLLALNAAIEASRAGEAGKGFAVVAEEIRKLSEQSKGSAESITNKLGVINSEVIKVTNTTDEASDKLKEQVKTIHDTMNLFKTIVTSIGNIFPQINNVNTVVGKINTDKNDILNSIEKSSRLAEQNSAASEEIAASTEEMRVSSQSIEKSSELLKDQTSNMVRAVEKFKL